MNTVLVPPKDCDLCPRLAKFRIENRMSYPAFYNAPVQAFGPLEARLLIVGLAPGLKGANQTGRPFTGDFAGDLLYATLSKFGFATGKYNRRPDDGLSLIDCRVTNGVRCVPPKNKPIGAEINSCRPFLENEIANMRRLECIVSLGTVSHGTVLTALGYRKSAYKFMHGALHQLPNGRFLANSYHCSRYNTNTGRLTEDMFQEVFAQIRSLLDG